MTQKQDVTVNTTKILNVTINVTKIIDVTLNVTKTPNVTNTQVCHDISEYQQGHRHLSKTSNVTMYTDKQVHQHVTLLLIFTTFRDKNDKVSVIK